MVRLESFTSRPLFGLTFLAIAASACLGSVDEMEREAARDTQVVSTVGRAQPALLSTCSASTPVDNLKELMIVDPSVVDGVEARNDTGESGGPLSFRSVMTKLAGDQDVSEFTERWIKTYITAQTGPNGSLTTSRAQADLVLKEFFGLSWPRTGGKLDMAQSPFRLLAVVNRMDLMGTAAGKPLGEGRLVYGWSKGGDKLMSIIFEFNLPGSTADLRRWAQRWHKLGSLPFGTEFNKTLVDDVTNKFVAPANLSQFRTNERLFATPWSLREFKLATVNGKATFVTSTTAQTPDFSFNQASNPAKVQELIGWINANKHEVMSHTHVLPASLLGSEAFANTPANETPQTFFGSKWLIRLPAGQSIAEDLRKAFAEETCGGCHNSENGAGTSGGFFYHVDPQRELLPGFPGGDGTGRLSPFVKDKELPARNKILSGLLSCSCIATYRVASRDDSGAEGRTSSAVTVRNISAAQVNSWQVSFSYANGERVLPGSVVSARTPATFDAAAPLFNNDTWNNFMVPNGTRTFRFETSYDKSRTNPVPSQLFVTCK